ncbi:MAG: outer membrane beta-barrel protein [Lactobacillaceae bacterium]|jgi:opacity protein-like surface antigen|nr:outer membrane beta-barrel protein [Lactobacillaceae bacterium]
MNKKILMALAAFCMTFSVANIAKADCDGIYLGVRGGMFKPKLGKDGALAGNFEIGKRTWSFGGAIGYRYEYVRAELEVILRGEPEETVMIMGTQAKEKFEAQSYMFNVFWDLSPYTMFTPYLMAGIGMSEIKVESRPQGMPIHAFDDNNFTWSLGGGLSAKVTSRFNVDVGYRYFDFDKLNETGVNGYEIYGGLRYVF